MTKPKRIDREGPIHRSVLDYLRKTLPGAMIHHSPNERDMRGVSAMRQIAKARDLGTVKGWPDIEILWRGHFWTMEVKAEGQYAKPEQREVGAAIIAAGGRWAVVRSIDDAAECVAEWRGDATADIPLIGVIS